MPPKKQRKGAAGKSSAKNTQKTSNQSKGVVLDQNGRSNKPKQSRRLASRRVASQSASLARVANTSRSVRHSSDREAPPATVTRAEFSEDDQDCVFEVAPNQRSEFDSDEDPPPASESENNVDQDDDEVQFAASREGSEQPDTHSQHSDIGSQSEKSRSSERRSSGDGSPSPKRCKRNRKTKKAQQGEGNKKAICQTAEYNG